MRLPPKVDHNPVSRPSGHNSGVELPTQAPSRPATSRLASPTAADAGDTLTRAPQRKNSGGATTTGRRADSFKAVGQPQAEQIHQIQQIQQTQQTQQAQQTHATASAQPRTTVADDSEIISNPSDHRNFNKIGGPAADSGNQTATYVDRNGNQWIGKKTTGLARAVSEVVAQRLATAVLGANRAPITLLANDGMIFSQKPAGPSENLGTFFSNPENFTGLTDEAKTSIQDSFLDALVFKAITGDCDDKPDNFVIDINRKTVIPIDGELAFPGTDADSDSYGTWSEEEFHKLINNPADHIKEIFKFETGGEPFFLSENIDPNTLLLKFSKQTNDIFEDDYALVNNAVEHLIADLAGFNWEKGTLSDDYELTLELDSKINKIKPMIETHVNQLYGYMQEMGYS